jgi:hypothetical protein
VAQPEPVRSKWGINGEVLNYQQKRIGTVYKVRGIGPNHPVHVTAARLRFGLNLNSLVWAAARDDGR